MKYLTLVLLLTGCTAPDQYTIEDARAQCEEHGGLVSVVNYREVECVDGTKYRNGRLFVFARAN